ncbi:MAG: PhnD/SsuA/transferrin family substrate-binding protein [Marinibacterium sp.]|nr:PhnD/SsuA/transferrin family substrate-binding protein [Marinibacterium sp.]
MYWRADTAQGWRGFWLAVQQAAPDLALPDLTPPDDLPTDWYDHWQRPDLALSMTCGLPFRSRLKGRVRYVTTPDFGVTEQPGYYRSVIVMRPGERPQGARRLAFNAPDSQSGWAAACAFTNQTDGLRITGLVETGSHAASMAAVATGRADLAALDAVTWRLLQRDDPHAGQVSAVAHTAPTPGLPLITARDHDPAPLIAALGAALATLSDDDRRQLGGLRGFAQLDPAPYYAQPLPPPPDA